MLQELIVSDQRVNVSLYDLDLNKVLHETPTDFDNFFYSKTCLTIAVYYQNLSKNQIECKNIVLKISILDV